MSDYPKISIVTTNFNQDRYLEQTILSVLNQEYPNLEYIIIDGGSTDNSVEIIKKYSDKLAYWESSQDKGMYDGLQKGLSKTTGEIMAWINSDDMYLPKSFFSVAEIFAKFTNVKWISGYPTIWDMKGRLVECPHLFKQWSKYDYLVGEYRWIQQESVFWRRSLWETIGSSLNTELKYAGDFDLWFRFFQTEKLYVTTALLSGFRMRDNQLSLKERSNYEYEINMILSNYTYKDGESLVVSNYKLINRLASFLSKMKIFHSNALVNKFKSKYFKYPPVIIFDRDNQQFEIMNNR